MASHSSLLDQITACIGSNAVLTGPDAQAYLEDWRGRYRGAALCVVLPANTGEVAAVVRLCVAHGVPVLPQGGNTSLCGGAVPATQDPAPVIVNVQRMRAVIKVDPANQSMDVQAGCVLANVQAAAAQQGMLYPISLGAEGSCLIGGTISTNAGGTGVLRYGNTRDNVLGLEVVLPSGEIWNGMTALRKNNTGLDLKHLFIGAEGTMGIITAAVLKLHPLPTQHALAWCAPKDPSAALSLLGLFQASCAARLSAFELMNGLQLDTVVEHVPDRKRPLEAPHEWHLLVELSDTGDGAELDATLQRVLEQAADAGLIDDAVIANSGAQRATLWEIRHSVSEANKKAGVGLTTDCAVPVSATPAFMEQATAAVHAIVPELPIIIVGHLGDGNVHFIPFFDHAAWAARADRDVLAGTLRHAVNDVAAALGGTFSAEHGVGQTGLAEMRHYKSTTELTLMHAVKAALDVDSLFNPGRLLP